MLTMRQQLEQHDYKVNFRLARSCEADINKHHCLDHIATVAGFKTAQMSAILLCLESAMKDGRYQSCSLQDQRPCVGPEIVRIGPFCGWMLYKVTKLEFITTHSELCKVLFLALSVTFVFVCL